MAESNSDNKITQTHVAYLSRGEFDDAKVYRGGILVVDRQGGPLEFRCTSPIRPNPVQRMLYGESLEPYMLIELMGRSLLKSLRESFDVLLVNEDYFLNLREHCKRPMAFIRRQGAELVAGSATGDQQNSKLVDSPSGKFDPIVAVVPHNHQEDATVINSLLVEISVRFDPLEPFERVQNALAKVHEQQAVEAR